MADEVEKVEADMASTRRSVLRFGAAAVPAAMTLRASPASAAASVLACRVPFSQTNFRVSGVDKWISSQGTLVAVPQQYDSVNGPFPPLAAGGYYTGQELKPVKTSGAAGMPTGKSMSNGSTTNSKAASAHYQYLYNNSQNSAVAGYTCMTSIINTP